jgi:chromate transporter
MFGALIGLFFRVVTFTFGGGEPTIAVFYQELVERRKWLSPETYGLIFALARVTPGTNLLAFCVGCAWHLRGWPGALGAALVSSLPGSAATVAFCSMYGVLERYSGAAAVIGGMLAAAVGLMAGGAYQLVSRYLSPRQALRTAVLTLGALGLSLSAGWSPVWILAAASLAGACWREEVTA